MNTYVIEDMVYDQMVKEALPLSSVLRKSTESFVSDKQHKQFKRFMEGFPIETKDPEGLDSSSNNFMRKRMRGLIAKSVAKNRNLFRNLQAEMGKSPSITLDKAVDNYASAAGLDRSKVRKTVEDIPAFSQLGGFGGTGSKRPFSKGGIPPQAERTEWTGGADVPPGSAQGG